MKTALNSGAAQEMSAPAASECCSAEARTESPPIFAPVRGGDDSEPRRVPVWEALPRNAWDRFGRLPLICGLCPEAAGMPHAISSDEKAQGPKHLETGVTLYGLRQVLAAQGRVAEVEEILHHQETG